MTEDISATDQFLNSFALDPKESEAALWQFAKDHAEVFERATPSPAVAIKYGEFLNREAPEVYSDAIIHMIYTGNVFAFLLGCIKHIEDKSIRKVAINRAVELYIRALRGVSNIPEDKPSAHRFTLTKQAKTMRNAKGEKLAARENALTAAIDAERGTRPILRPYKEAFSMLDAVNGRLEVAGFEPVKVDAVRRRLEKRAALFKSAEKAAE